MNPGEEAIKLLDEVGIDSLPVIPRKICEQLHISYVEEPLKEIDGVLFLDNGLRGMICVNSNIIEKGRKNFTGAHELGHYCLDSSESNHFYCPRSNIGAASGNSPRELLAAARKSAKSSGIKPRHIWLKAHHGALPLSGGDNSVLRWRF